MARKRLNETSPEAAFEKNLRNDRVLKTLFKVMLDQDNRLRALEGRAALSAADARDRLKALFMG
jgi:hypothetical protein